MKWFTNCAAKQVVSWYSGVRFKWGNMNIFGWKIAHPNASEAHWSFSNSLPALTATCEWVEQISLEKVGINLALLCGNLIMAAALVARRWHRHARRARGWIFRRRSHCVSCLEFWAMCSQSKTLHVKNVGQCQKTTGMTNRSDYSFAHLSSCPLQLWKIWKTITALF